MGTGKIPYSSFKVQLYFPILGLAVILKKRFPHSRLCRSWGNLSSVFLLSLSWGNIIVPFMTHREFLFPSLAAARLVKEISRPHFLKWQDWAISLSEGYLLQLIISDCIHLQNTVKWPYRTPLVEIILDVNISTTILLFNYILIFFCQWYTGLHNGARDC